MLLPSQSSWHYYIGLLLSCWCLLLHCGQAPAPQQANNAPASTTQTTQVSTSSDTLKPITTKSTIVLPQVSAKDFPWLENYENNNALAAQILVPAGYQRVSYTDNSFGTWLRTLPLQAAGTPVRLFNGEQKNYQVGAYRVLDIDIGSRDLQQCADAVMRLRAEYLYQQKAYSDIHFNYTSGHTIHFSDWASGKKPSLKSGKVRFSAATGNKDYSYKNFKRYLTNVYCYAGTASLSKELNPKSLNDLEAGDVFIWGGFPGHAILVMDVAVQVQTGEKIFLLAQSYMPAQSIHILKNLEDADLSPWYRLKEGETLYTPEWTFEAGSLMEF